MTLLKLNSKISFSDKCFKILLKSGKVHNSKCKREHNLRVERKNKNVQSLGKKKSCVPSSTHRMP